MSFDSALSDSGTLDLALEAVVAIAAAVTALAAWLALGVWKRELRGRADFELARRLLHRLYELRDKIQFLRVSAVFPHEWSSRSGRPEGQPLATADDLSYVYRSRWEEIQNALASLEVDLREAEALWADLLAESQEQLGSCVTELRVHLRWYLRGLDNPSHQQRDPERWRKVEEIIGDGDEGAENDDFATRVRGAVRSFEEQLRPKLRR